LKYTLALITVLFTILLFVSIIKIAAIRGTMYFYDNELQILLNKWGGGEFKLIMYNIIKYFDEYLVWIIPTIIFIILILKKDWWNILAIFLSIGAGMILIFYLQSAFHIWSHILNIVDRGGDPFPSGHACFAMIIFGFTLYIALDFLESNCLKALILSLCTLSILLIGISLISLCHHWFAEVIAGYCVGYFSFLISILTIKTIAYFIKA
jgi:membrane-associated phospholipid phosphatase